MAQAQEKIHIEETESTGSQELIVWEKLDPAKLFKEGGLDSVLKEIDEKARSVILEGVETAKDRGNIRAIASKVSRAKTFVQKIGTKNTEEYRVLTKESNSERDRGVAFLQELQNDIRKPLTEYEDAEKKAKQLIENRIGFLSDCALFEIGEPDSEEIRCHLSDLEEGYKIDWEEDVIDRASYAYDRAKSKLGQMLEHRLKYESDQKELTELRESQAAQAKKDEEERIRKEAADKATKDAEEKAKTERESSEKAAADKLAAEQEKTRRLEQDKKDAKDREEKVESDRIDAEMKADQDKRNAVQAEKDRVAAKDKREKEETEKREANKKHREKINSEVKEAIIKYAEITDPETRARIRSIIEAIARGEIPNITISY